MKLQHRSDFCVSAMFNCGTFGTEARCQNPFILSRAAVTAEGEEEKEKVPLLHILLHPPACVHILPGHYLLSSSVIARINLLCQRVLEQS